jgi:hypothetical protein
MQLLAKIVGSVYDAEVEVVLVPLETHIYNHTTHKSSVRPAKYYVRIIGPVSQPRRRRAITRA